VLGLQLCPHIITPVCRGVGLSGVRFYRGGWAFSSIIKTLKNFIFFIFLFVFFAVSSYLV
jgi:hypothetical protein